MVRVTVAVPSPQDAEQDPGWTLLHSESTQSWIIVDVGEAVVVVVLTVVGVVGAVETVVCFVVVCFVVVGATVVVVVAVVTVAVVVDEAVVVVDVVVVVVVERVVEVAAVVVAGQYWVLHGCDSDSTGQTAPPLLAYVRISRVRILLPPPQLTVHIVYDVHSATTQSTGHACVLHAMLSTSAPQATPPKLACVTTVRVRDCVPVPQGFVQVV